MRLSDDAITTTNIKRPMKNHCTINSATNDAPFEHKSVWKLDVTGIGIVGPMHVAIMPERMGGNQRCVSKSWSRTSLKFYLAVKSSSIKPCNIGHLRRRSINVECINVISHPIAHPLGGRQNIIVAGRRRLNASDMVCE